MIPPSEFIPIAENCGLIVQLGLFSMQMAAEHSQMQENTGDEQLFISVNLLLTNYPPRPRIRCTFC